MQGQPVSTIGPGILALIGVCQDDTPEHMDLLTKKILQLKLWPEGARVVDGVLAPGCLLYTSDAADEQCMV